MAYFLSKKILTIKSSILVPFFDKILALPSPFPPHEAQSPPPQGEKYIPLLPALFLHPPPPCSQPQVCWLQSIDY